MNVTGELAQRRSIQKSDITGVSASGASDSLKCGEDVSNNCTGRRRRGCESLVERRGNCGFIRVGVVDRVIIHYNDDSSEASRKEIIDRQLQIRNYASERSWQTGSNACWIGKT